MELVHPRRRRSSLKLIRPPSSLPCYSSQDQQQLHPSDLDSFDSAAALSAAIVNGNARRNKARQSEANLIDEAKHSFHHHDDNDLSSDDSFATTICNQPMDVILNYRCLYHPLEIKPLLSIASPIQCSVLLNNQIYFLGGKSENIEMSVVDLTEWISSCSFSVAPLQPLRIKTKSSITMRSSFTCVANPDDGMVYLFGGARGFVTFNDVWRFNPSTKRWKCLKSPSLRKPAARCGHSAVVYRGKMYVFGGRSMGQTEKVSPVCKGSAGASQRRSSLCVSTPSESSCATASSLMEGFTKSVDNADNNSKDVDCDLVTFRTTTSSVESSTSTSSPELPPTAPKSFSPFTRRSQPIPYPILINSSNPTSTVSSSSSSYRRQSQGTSSYRYADLWSFDLQTFEWTNLTRSRCQATLDDFPSARDDHSAVVIGGSMYLFGGMRNSVGTQPRILNDLWVYSFMDQCFRRLHPSSTTLTPPPRQRHCSFELQGNLIIQGGDSGDGIAFNDIWEFQLTTSSWRSIRYASFGKSPQSICGGVTVQCNPYFASLIGTSAATAATTATESTTPPAVTSHPHSEECDDECSSTTSSRLRTSSVASSDSSSSSDASIPETTLLEHQQSTDDDGETVTLLHTSTHLYVVRFEAPPVSRWISATRRLSIKNNSLAEENTRLQAELEACRRTLTQQILQHNVSKAMAFVEQRKLCIVCYAKDVRYAFDPCGHTCTCEDCATKLVEENGSNCPMCRTPITHALRIHLA